MQEEEIERHFAFGKGYLQEDKVEELEIDDHNYFEPSIGKELIRKDVILKSVMEIIYDQMKEKDYTVGGRWREVDRRW